MGFGTFYQFLGQSILYHFNNISLLNPENTSDKQFLFQKSNKKGRKRICVFFSKETLIVALIPLIINIISEIISE